MKKRTIGFIFIGLAVAGFIGYYFWVRRWRTFEDNNFVGNTEFNRVAFVTDKDSKLAAGDMVEIEQDKKAGAKESYNGRAEVFGVSQTPGGKFLFIIEKPWAGSSPVVPGRWRKLNLF